MNYINICENFLGEKPNYRSDINLFNSFLICQNINLEDKNANLKLIMQGIDVDYLLQSLKYNVEIIKKYKTKSKAYRYVSAISTFFLYIMDKGFVENKGLRDALSYNKSRESKYMKTMCQYIENCELLQGVIEYEAVESAIVRQIIFWADNQLADCSEWSEHSSYRKAIAALGIKFMLLYGITYRELRAIRLSQYNRLRNSVTINHIELRLPYNMTLQVERVYDYYMLHHSEDKREFLFSDYEGNQWGEITSSSGIPDYVYSIIGKTSVTSLMKYGISQLLNAGLNDSIIKQITGASDKIIRSCILEHEGDMSRDVNNKLVTVELYYEF